MKKFYVAINWIFRFDQESTIAVAPTDHPMEQPAVHPHIYIAMYVLISDDELDSLTTHG